MPTVTSVTWSWIQIGFSSSGSVGVEVEMIVVVIGVAVVLVHEILAEQMVGERVALFLVVVVRHSSLFLARQAAPCYRTAVSPWSKGKSFEGDRRKRRPLPRATTGSALPFPSLTEPGRPVTLRPPNSPDRMDVTVTDSKTHERHGGGSLYRAARRARHRICLRQCRNRFRPDRGGALPEQGCARRRASWSCRTRTWPMAMAHGYYRIAGKPAAVMVHVTVGTANAMNGIINAARDNIPVLLAAGRTPITETGSIASRNRPIHWGQEAFDQGGMLREYVKWDYELRSGQPVEAVVDRALDIAMSEPRGPVYLTLPREVLTAPGVKPRRDNVRPLGSLAPEPARAAIEQAASLIAKAEFPIIVTSSVGRVPAAVGALAALAEEFALPVVQAEAARHEPADRPSHASRPQRRRVPAEGRRGDRDRQRGAVDAAQPSAAQGRQGHPHFRRSAGDALSVPRARSRPPGRGLVAGGHEHAARDPRRGDEGQEDRDREPAQGIGRYARRDRRQAPQADRDREGPDADPSGLARPLHQPGEIGGRHRHQRARRAAADPESDEAGELHGRAALGRARLRAWAPGSAPSSRRRSAR